MTIGTRVLPEIIRSWIQRSNEDARVRAEEPNNSIEGSVEWHNEMKTEEDTNTVVNNPVKRPARTPSGSNKIPRSTIDWRWESSKGN